ncbi:hypothetical protein [Nocardioides acrostichi]|uniref:Uncharacterized protein n=1 Tax=Nocardioides acrostichi TaxID=2784339 RepID=A0A930Y6I5_9ACTN|nr:hypothetical protein [Nocardioides acrostichi]MBF4162395.1 hypothetical protein [Nocardioides acrostichi]
MVRRVTAGLGLLALGAAHGVAAVVLAQSWGWLAVALVAGGCWTFGLGPGYRLAWTAGVGAAVAVSVLPRHEGGTLLGGAQGWLLALTTAIWLGVAIATLPAPGGLVSRMSR